MSETASLEEGTQFHVMPGSTFRKTYEVLQVRPDGVEVQLIDQAVGYEYATKDSDERKKEYSHEKLDALSENGQLAVISESG